jgi:dienelactone hydrolase
MRVDRRRAIRSFAGAALGGILPPLSDALKPGLCLSKNVPDFEPFCFTDDAGTRHQLYVKNGGGPPVMLLHELPGLVDPDLETARRLADLHYTVIAPLLFGDPGGKGDSRGNLRHVCDVDQFACGHGNVTSPHIYWLRQLSHAVREQWPEGKGVGVIGMCLTGAFPIAMLRSTPVAAAVLCQPTIPFNLFTPLGLFTDSRALGIHKEDLLYATSKSTVPLLGIRYTGDRLSRRQRFDRMTDDFKERFYRLDLNGKQHSSLGKAFCQEAFLEVESFLNQFLRATPDPKVGSFPRRARNNSHDEVRIDCLEASHAPHK